MNEYHHKQTNMENSTAREVYALTEILSQPTTIPIYGINSSRISACAWGLRTSTWTATASSSPYMHVSVMHKPKQSGVDSYLNCLICTVWSSVLFFIGISVHSKVLLNINWTVHNSCKPSFSTLRGSVNYHTILSNSCLPCPWSCS